MTLVSIVAEVTLSMLTFSMFFALMRLAQGPTLADRVVALDLTSTLVVGIIAIYTIYVKEPVLLQAAVVLALLSFVGTIAFATYVERRGRP